AKPSHRLDPNPRLPSDLPRVPQSRRGRGPAHPAWAVPHARGIGDRREDDSIRFADSLLVGAAAPADDPRARAADQRGGGALEPQELGLHRAPEGVVAPGSVTADDAVAWDDHRHRIGPERVADRARGARMTNAAREGRIVIDLAELNAARLAEHTDLEVDDALEVDPP